MRRKPLRSLIRVLLVAFDFRLDADVLKILSTASTSNAPASGGGGRVRVLLSGKPNERER